MAKTRPFDEHPGRYERWFEDNWYVYRSELKAIESVFPASGRGVEIGIGSGRFAEPLGITEGVEPSQSMRRLAAGRGLAVTDGVAEALPLEDGSYDFALMVTTICFVDDPRAAFGEMRDQRRDSAVESGRHHRRRHAAEHVPRDLADHRAGVGDIRAVRARAQFQRVRVIEPRR